MFLEVVGVAVDMKGDGEGERDDAMVRERVGGEKSHVCQIDDV